MLAFYQGSADFSHSLILIDQGQTLAQFICLQMNFKYRVLNVCSLNKPTHLLLLHYRTSINHIQKENVHICNIKFTLFVKEIKLMQISPT